MLLARMTQVMHWPALIKRLRFLAGVTQVQFAEMISIEQGTISRWERGVHVPDMSVQKYLRDMLCKLEPALPPGAIEAMPHTALLYCTHTSGLLVCCSHTVAGDHQMCAKDMRYMNLAPHWPDSVQEMHDTIEGSDAWRDGEIALVRAKIYRIDNNWCDVTGMPVNGSGLFFYTGIPSNAPAEISTNNCEITILTKDEMCS